MHVLNLTLTGRDLSILKKCSPDSQPIWRQENYSCTISLIEWPTFDGDDLRLYITVSEQSYEYRINPKDDKKAIYLIKEIFYEEGIEIESPFLVLQEEIY